MLFYYEYLSKIQERMMTSSFIVVMSSCALGKYYFSSHAYTYLIITALYVLGWFSRWMSLPLLPSFLPLPSLPQKRSKSLSPQLLARISPFSQTINSRSWSTFYSEESFGDNFEPLVPQVCLRQLWCQEEEGTRWMGLLAWMSFHWIIMPLQVSRPCW